MFRSLQSTVRSWQTELTVPPLLLSLSPSFSVCARPQVTPVNCQQLLDAVSMRRSQYSSPNLEIQSDELQAGEQMARIYQDLCSYTAPQRAACYRDNMPITAWTEHLPSLPLIDITRKDWHDIWCHTFQVLLTPFQCFSILQSQWARTYFDEWRKRWDRGSEQSQHLQGVNW